MSYNITEKKTIKETLTVGFNHAVADTGEGGPLIFNKRRPEGPKKIFSDTAPPPPHNDSLVEAVMLNCL